MDYTGEHLLPGLLGHFFIILSLVASLVATFAYFKAVQSKQLDASNPPNVNLLSELTPRNDYSAWKKLARAAFFVEVLSVFAIFGILFYIIYNHLFEYKYAWQHSSKTLEVKYLLSCFWEGQEGSFLLWSIWHCVLGLILIRKARNWEAPVMTVVSFAQVCLATMIAGIYFFNWKMGTNPFVLLRNEMDAPIFSQPNYLSLIRDGNDLNPLLQNYWMVIHPPVLFLGFCLHHCSICLCNSWFMDEKDR
jgi:cytochrome c-type biogenesis protein CcmF